MNLQAHMRQYKWIQYYKELEQGHFFYIKLLILWGELIFIPHLVLLWQLKKIFFTQSSKFLLVFNVWVSDWGIEYCMLEGPGWGGGLTPEHKCESVVVTL